MIFKIILYIICLSAIILLPESIWEKSLNIFQRLKSLKKTSKGESLLMLFPEIEMKMSLGLKSLSFDLPQYKFYTDLVQKLFHFHRHLGINLKNILPDLRLNLMKDLQFEKKIKSHSQGGNVQFAAVTLTTWIFIFLSSTIADLPLNFFDLAIILFLQTSAFFFFNGMLSFLKKWAFSIFAKPIESLYLFMSLVEIGLPVSEVLKQSQILAVPLKSTSNRVEMMVMRYKDNGISPKQETQEIIKEVWSQCDMRFEKFIREVDLLKFFTLAFFFLPAYFYYLYSIFKFFLQN